MDRLFEDEECRDVFFKLDTGKVYGAHRVVLMTSDATWFRTILKSNFKERNASVIEIHDVSEGAMKIALRWCYDLSSWISEEELEDIFSAFTFFAFKSQSHLICLNERGSFDQEVEFIHLCLKYSGHFIDRLWYRRFHLRHVIILLECYPTSPEDFLLLMNMIRPITPETHYLVLHDWMMHGIKSPNKPSKMHRDATIALLTCIPPTFITERYYPCRDVIEKLVEEDFLSLKELDKMNLYHFETKYNEEFCNHAQVLSGYPIRIGYWLNVEDVQSDKKPVQTMKLDDGEDIYELNVYYDD